MKDALGKSVQANGRRSDGGLRNVAKGVGPVEAQWAFCALNSANLCASVVQAAIV